MTKHLPLPKRLDTSGAQPLAQVLLDRRGGPLTLDASEVEVMGALAFEVIIAAGRQWDLDGQTLAMGPMSDRYVAACDALGLRADAPWLTGFPAAQGGGA
ncbi:MAG: chemotaxis protein CheX [Rhodobacteraceae bacterium PARR1]|nr:MAG: chemotaxis protein CheX [Rhodobacteraceae bacterium PARR1]